MSQTARWSAIESATNIAVGILVAFATQLAVFPLFGLHASTEEHAAITLIFTLVSFLRSYALRRLFCRLGGARG